MLLFWASRAYISTCMHTYAMEEMGARVILVRVLRAHQNDYEHAHTCTHNYKPITHTHTQRYTHIQEAAFHVVLGIHALH